MIKTYFFAKQTPRKRDGMYPIMVRIVLNDQRAQFTTNVHLHEEYLPFINDSLLESPSNLHSIMKELIGIKQQIERIYDRMCYDNCLTPDMIVAAFKKECSLSMVLFLESLRGIINEKKEQEVSRKTIEKYELLYNRLLSFIQKRYKKSDITTRNIDHYFITGYKQYLKRDFKYSATSLDKLMQLFQSARRSVSVLAIYAESIIEEKEEDDEI